MRRSNRAWGGIEMKLIESKAELLPWEPGVEGVYKAIERAGRTCYRSEDKMTDGSAKGFVDRMIKSRHLSMLEHGSVYLKWYSPGIFDRVKGHTVYDYIHNPYTKSVEYLTKDSLIQEATEYRITTNYRVLIENNWLDDLQYLCDTTEFHEMRYSFKFTCDRGIMAELTRHRAFSFAVESTRYCNYSKDKFGGELSLKMPDRSAWYGKEESKGEAYWDMLRLLDDIERVYLEAIKCGVQPQVARDILPNATKTEIVMTGFASDWRYLFDIRLFGKTGAPHPDMVDLMEKAKVEAEKNGIWNDIMSCPSKFEL